MQLAGRLETPYLDSNVLKGNLPGDLTERMLPVYLPLATCGRRRGGEQS